MAAVALAVEPPVAPPVIGDQALIDATVAGDGAAFGELVGRYERAVFNLALRTMRDRGEAEDATQEAFFKAYRALAGFRPGAKFSTWISRFATGCAATGSRNAAASPTTNYRTGPTPAPARRSWRNGTTRRRGCGPQSTPFRRNTAR